MSTAAPGLVRDLVRGSIYTPPALTRFVVDRALGSADAASLRWLDPACGDGVFLAEIVARIAAEVPSRDLAEVVERSVFGTDIDPLACGLAVERVRADVQRRVGPLPREWFRDNVRRADYLASGEGWPLAPDVVVGNPPYVSATGLSGVEKADFVARYESAWGRIDLYALFFERALRHVAAGGRVALLTPDKFLTSESGRRLRRLIAESSMVESIDRFSRHDLFPGVSTVPAVTAIVRDLERVSSGPERSVVQWWDVEDETVVGHGQPMPVQITKNGGTWVSRVAAPAQSRTTFVPLGSLVHRISAGWATGLNPCFVMRCQDVGDIEPELLRPVVRGRDIDAGSFSDSERVVLLPYEPSAPGSPMRLADLSAYPGARRHLESHRAALEKRHCVRVWGKAWYDLHDPVTQDLSAVRKIMVPDLARSSRFALDHGTVVPLHSAYYLQVGLEVPRPEVLVAALNSQPVEELLMRTSPIAKSGYRRLRAQFLREIPIPAGLLDDESLVVGSGDDAVIDTDRIEAMVCRVG